MSAAPVSPLDRRPSAVLFDMDGLILDSERALLECWRRASDELALGLDDELWLSMIGVHEAACRDLLHARLPRERADALIERTNALYDDRVRAGLPTRPGLEPLLDWLDAEAVPRAIATSTLRETAETKLRAAGVRERFHALVAGGDVARFKPAPDVYLAAAEALRTDPRDCLVLEDSEPGVRAALAAGCVPIQIPDLAAPSEAIRALGHRIVDSLHDALALLRATPASQGRHRSAG